MRLAVVIPCYNHARYIGAAIRSVVGQTRKVDRLIIIDDGSSDDSVAAIRALDEPMVELVEQENQNAFNAINRGVRMAARDCDAIAILNSDDHYHPGRFARLLPLLENDDSVSVVCSGLHLIDEDDQPLAADHPRARWFEAAWSVAGGDDLDIVSWIGLCNFPATTSNILARADYLMANPFQPYHYNHDYYFLSGAALRGCLGAVREPLVNYRVHATNTMNTGVAPLMKEVLRQQVDFLRDFHSEMAGDPEMRRRYKLYLAAAFDNISAFHSGLFLHLLGGLLQQHPAAETDAIIAALDGTSHPELTTFPNRHHVNCWTGSGPLGRDGALAEKLEALRIQRDQLKGSMAINKELSRLLAGAAGCKRYALGRLLGLAPKLDRLPGKNQEEKLAALRDLIDRNHWLRRLR